MKHTLVLAALFLSTAARAQDVSALWEISTDGTTAKLKEGEKGKVVIAIVTKPGAHVSDEAPLKLELSSKSGKLDKQKLTLADSVNKKAEGSKDYPTPKFEIGYAPAGKGSGAVDAKLVFFVCTDKLCARQSKNLSLPVDVQ